MPVIPEKPDTPPAADPQHKRGMNVQLSGLLGIVIAIVVLVFFIKKPADQSGLVSAQPALA